MRGCHIVFVVLKQTLLYLSDFYAWKKHLTVESGLFVKMEYNGDIFIGKDLKERVLNNFLIDL